MDIRRLNAALREGAPLPKRALAELARGLADGSVSDAQAGAFAMAACLRGLGEAGRVALTQAMRDSGTVLRWDLPGPVLDKHSTGGLGDAVSLILAPALAACGAYVPMIAGRGLGHTGGTIDKLESIPGLRTDFGAEALQDLVRAQGAAIVAASAEIAPADRRLYAIRDVSGTVESIDLITASILSKKLAAGISALVMDVKCGTGAFMATPSDARQLAHALVDTARGAGCPTVALITDMNQPLAPAAGNALEVAVAMQTLARPSSHPALVALTEALGGEVLALAGLARRPGDGAAMILQAMESGRATERFAAMINAQGGPRDFAENWRTHLPAAPVIRPLPCPQAGVLAAVDGRALGHAVIGLGGGRRVESDHINPAVGLSEIARIGARLEPGEPLCLIHAADEAAAMAAQAALAGAFTLADAALPPLLVQERIA
ncbi:MAG: thymidine phosphorylase [Rhodobacteraceae bacterium]|nr:thymidine phosphorylase [Paracoccaceae bacterium]